MKQFIFLIGLVAMMTLSACSGDEKLSFDPKGDAKALTAELLKVADAELPDVTDTVALNSLQARVDSMAVAYINFYAARAEKIDDPEVKKLYALQVDTLKSEFDGKGKAEIAERFAGKRASLEGK